MQNLLVTGGCGFIGSNFIRYLLKESGLREDEHSFTGRIINVDKLTYAGNPDSLEDIEKEFGQIGQNHETHENENNQSSDNKSQVRYIFEKADICNMAEMERIFQAYQIDSVCHFAAESHVDRSIASPEIFIDTNIKGTFNLLECSRKRFLENNSGSSGGTDDKKSRFILFHHISTDEVYGTLGKTGYFTENTPYSPNSPYSASKAASDHLVRAWHETYGLPVTISNCSNNYGPFQFPEKLIPLMILNALDGKELPIYGEGKNIRDWLYVRDHCSAIWLIMQKGVRGGTYNIGGGCELENRAVVENICAIVDRAQQANLTGNVRFEINKTSSQLSSSKELIRFVKDRPGHDFRYAIDCTRLKEELGWQPEESFKTGIERTVQWYLNNIKWVQRIKSGEYLNWIKSHYKE
ncbi:MAG: dTDP-glucose 4,6-dehydratase [Desulfamplus sp.]|nr:dTDP-glucose 4,6-dehydratase [Desulfamplus sp.]